MKKRDDNHEISILAISQAAVTLHVLGTTPLVYNRMAEKARRELLLPRGRKTAADRAATLKHNPLEEYRASVYRYTDDTQPTRLCFPAPAFKSALATAALDLPGARKAQIGRLTWVAGTEVEIYGVPKLMMSVVRSADPNRTPDIRTRAVVPRWACKVTINYVQPQLSAQSIANLLSAAGVLVGIGDFRQEKGKGSYGQFQLVEATDMEWCDVVLNGGRKAQDAALEHPKPYDAETAEQLDWFGAEIVRLGRAA
jgi:hypothetical protein